MTVRSVRRCVRAVRARAAPVDDQNMIRDLEAHLLRDIALALLDRWIEEFLDSATLLTHDVVVVVTAIEFEDRLPSLEVMLLGEAGVHELRQHAIDRRQSDLLPALQQLTIDILGGHVTRVARLEDLEDLHARQGHLKTRLTDVLVLHLLPPATVFWWGIRYHSGRMAATDRDNSLQMPKLLIFILFVASAFTTGCSSLADSKILFDGVTNAIPNALDRSSLVYRPTIQQGNIVTQEQVNELRPGMTKRQVRFLLGTPMLADVFHANRWDYAFTQGVGSIPTERRHVTVFFENDRLVRITGDLRPEPQEEREEVSPEVVVSVPDWEPPDKSLWRRALESVGIDPYED